LHAALERSAIADITIAAERSRGLDPDRPFDGRESGDVGDIAVDPFE